MSMRNQSLGFTMVELAVTMAIFTLLISVVLANYRSFTGNADFANATESVALALREAQIYGVGSKQASVACGTPASTFNCPYGASFKVGQGQYVIFVDQNENRIYDSATDTVVRTVVLPTGVTISGASCAVASCGTGFDVTFKRPSPDALIGATGEASAVLTLSRATTGKTSSIRISRAGQFSIQ